MRRALIALLLIVPNISGCFLLVRAIKEGQKREVCTALLGQHVDEVLKANGLPTSRFTLSNGNMILVWRMENGVMVSGSISTNGTYSGTYTGSSSYGTYTGSGSYDGSAVRLWCETNYEVHPSGVIVGYNFQGTSCGRGSDTLAAKQERERIAHEREQAAQRPPVPANPAAANPSQCQSDADCSSGHCFRSVGTCSN